MLYSTRSSRHAISTIMVHKWGAIVSLDKYIFTHPYLIVLCSMCKTHDKKLKSIVFIMHNHIETVYIAQLSLQNIPSHIIIYDNKQNSKS